MTNLSLFPEETDSTTLPLIVAKRWNFPLAHLQTDNGMMYAVQDWMRGLTGEEDVNHKWSMFKKTAQGRQTVSLIYRLPYKARDGKTYKRDHTNDKGLYLIAQYLRVKQDRPVLDEIRRYLAAAGAFVDEIRRDPDILVKSVKDADKLLDAFIEYHRSRGKDDIWIKVRLESTMQRNKFTAALNEYVLDVLTPRHFATATDDVYWGLWGRNSAALKQELGIEKSQNLREHQPFLALAYQGIAEQVCAQKLGQREEVTWGEARDIINTVSTMIGRQAKETGDLLQQDIATGRPLLNTGA